MSYAAKSFLPASKLTDSEMEMILQRQAVLDAAKAETRERNMNVYNKQVARSRVKIGNWFEEQEYWDALEERDAESVCVGSVLADPNVDPRKTFVTTSSVYGSKIRPEDVKLDTTHTRKVRPFTDDERVHNRASHQIIPAQYDAFKQAGTRDHRPDILPPCRFDYDVTAYQVRPGQ